MEACRVSPHNLQPVCILACVALVEEESVCLGLSLNMREIQCMHQHPGFASQLLCPLCCVVVPGSAKTSYHQCL